MLANKSSILKHKSNSLRQDARGSGGQKTCRTNVSRRTSLRDGTQRDCGVFKTSNSWVPLVLFSKQLDTRFVVGTPSCTPLPPFHPCFLQRFCIIEHRAFVTCSALNCIIVTSTGGASQIPLSPRIVLRRKSVDVRISSISTAEACPFEPTLPK